MLYFNTPLSRSEMNVKLTAIVTKDALLFGAPVPDHHSTVLGPGHHIAILTDITLRSSYACHDVVVAKYRLNHRTCNPMQHQRCSVRLCGICCKKDYTKSYRWIWPKFQKKLVLAQLRDGKILVVIQIGIRLISMY